MRPLQQMIIEGTQPLPTVTEARRVDVKNGDFVSREPQIDMLEIA